MEYEYKIVDIESDGTTEEKIRQREKILNDMSAQGWEHYLVDRGFWFYFRREKRSDIVKGE